MQEDQQSRLYTRYLYLKKQRLLLKEYSLLEKVRKQKSEPKVRITSPDGKVYDGKRNWINKDEWLATNKTEAPLLVLINPKVLDFQKAE